MQDPLTTMELRVRELTREGGYIIGGPLDRARFWDGYRETDDKLSYMESFAQSEADGWKDGLQDTFMLFLADELSLDDLAFRLNVSAIDMELWLARQPDSSRGAKDMADAWISGMPQ